MSKESNVIEKILTGTVTFATFGKTSKDKTDKYRVTFNADKFDKTDFIKAYEKSDLKPKFITDDNCYLINIKSLFDFPCKITDSDVDLSDYDVDHVSEWLETGEIIDAKIKIKVKLKEGAIYPVAMTVEKLGSIYNPFEGL